MTSWSFSGLLSGRMARVINVSNRLSFHWRQQPQFWRNPPPSTFCHLSIWPSVASEGCYAGISSLWASPKKIPNFLLPVRTTWTPTPRVYSIPCECGWVCNGQTGCSIETGPRSVQLTHHPYNGGIKLLGNVDQCLPDCMAQHPKRHPFSELRFKCISQKGGYNTYFLKAKKAFCPSFEWLW